MPTCSKAKTVVRVYAVLDTFALYSLHSSVLKGSALEASIAVVAEADVNMVVTQADRVWLGVNDEFRWKDRMRFLSTARAAGVAVVACENSS